MVSSIGEILAKLAIISFFLQAKKNAEKQGLAKFCSQFYGLYFVDIKFPIFRHIFLSLQQ
jgi:hypothetical protein